MKYLHCLQPLIISGFLFFTLIGCNAAQKNSISPAEFAEGIKKPDIQILDVRTPGEFNSGYIKNALLADWTNKEEFTRRTAALDPAKPVYVYCLSGGRSHAAMELLQQKGFSAYNLSGGIKSWKSNGFPLEQPVQAKAISKTDFLASLPKTGEVLVDIGASWCPPCVKMEPVIKRWVSSKNGRVALVKVDAAAQLELANELGAEMYPTFIFFKDGVELKRNSGILTVEDLEKLLQ